MGERRIQRDRIIYNIYQQLHKCTPDLGVCMPDMTVCTPDIEICTPDHVDD